MRAQKRTWNLVLAASAAAARGVRHLLVLPVQLRGGVRLHGQPPGDEQEDVRRQHRALADEPGGEKWTTNKNESPSHIV